MGRRILFTEKDIRELQLAKGALAAGRRPGQRVRLLLGEIKTVLLAGAFGSTLSTGEAPVGSVCSRRSWKLRWSRWAMRPERGPVWRQ